jgi:thiamine transport system substrate-binding protein
MRVNYLLPFFFVAAVSAFVGCKKADAANTSGGGETVAAPVREAVVWTYDSFTSEWGPGPEAAKIFEEKTSIKLRWVAHGDAGTMLSRLLLEGANSGADVVLGLDQNLAPRALASGLFEAYKPAGAEAIYGELLGKTGGARDWRLIPFDYSHFAIIYDSERIAVPPRSLEDLTQSAYAKKLILMDPRTSSPGLGFLSWTKTVYGDKWPDYWRRLQPSILTIADGWSAGYGLFTEGEAPLVLSYTTIPGYHLEYENSERFLAAIFPDGHPMQIELAGLLAGSKNKAEARAFLDFMLSEDFQALIPLTNWMYPVIDIDLPASYRINPKPTKTLETPPAVDAAVSDTDLTRWAGLFR